MITTIVVVTDDTVKIILLLFILQLIYCIYSYIPNALLSMFIEGMKRFVGTICKHYITTCNYHQCSFIALYHNDTDLNVSGVVRRKQEVRAACSVRCDHDFGVIEHTRCIDV